MKCENDCPNKARWRCDRLTSTTPVSLDECTRFLVNGECNDSFLQRAEMGEWYWKEVFLCGRCYRIERKTDEVKKGKRI